MNIRLLVITLLSFVAFTAGPVSAQSTPLPEVKAMFAGRTFIHYNKAHGTQVEFMSKNGRTYLFYPGNKSIVTGTWKVERWPSDKRLIMVCFKYQSNSYNPITGSTGDQWECGPLNIFLADIVQRTDGDPLGLSKRKQVPFVLKKKKADFDDLLRQLN